MVGVSGVNTPHPHENAWGRRVELCGSGAVLGTACSQSIANHHKRMAPAGAPISSFRPGQPLHDTAGNVIDAHGDHVHTCKQHSGSKKEAHETIVEAIQSLLTQAGLSNRDHCQTSKGSNA